MSPARQIRSPPPGRIEFQGTVGSGQTIASDSAVEGAQINVDTPLAFAGTLAGLPVGFNIDLAGFVLTGGSFTGTIGGNGSWWWTERRTGCPARSRRPCSASATSRSCR